MSSQSSAFIPTDFSCFPDATDAKQRPGKQFLINFFGLLPEDQAADHERGSHSSRIDQQAGCQRVAATTDRNRSEVDGQYVECGFLLRLGGWTLLCFDRFGEIGKTEPFHEVGETFAE
jgi:hypothetical protein